MATEVVLGAGALAAAAVLASVAPPVSAGGGRPSGLEASGADFGTSVRVTLRAASAVPGPNRFEAMVSDYDSGRTRPADAVSLRFFPVDDPGVEPTTLDLQRGPGRSWSGSGSNLAFDGRWRVTALVQRASDAVAVPVELDISGPPQFLSIERLPGVPVRHTVELAAGGYARVWVEPDRPGFNRVYASFFGRDANLRPVDRVVLTTQAGSGAFRRHPLRTIGEGRYVTDVAVPDERTNVAVVARTPDGSRLRATVDLDATTG